MQDRPYEVLRRSTRRVSRRCSRRVRPGQARAGVVPRPSWSGPLSTIPAYGSTSPPVNVRRACSKLRVPGLRFENASPLASRAERRLRMETRHDHVAAHTSQSDVEAVVEPGNLKKALARVRRNKGAPAVDGMTVDELSDHLKVRYKRPGEKDADAVRPRLPDPVDRSPLAAESGLSHTVDTRRPSHATDRRRRPANPALPATTDPSEAGGVPRRRTDRARDAETESRAGDRRKQGATAPRSRCDWRAVAPAGANGRRAGNSTTPSGPRSPTCGQRTILHVFSQEAEWQELISAWAEGRVHAAPTGGGPLTGPGTRSAARRERLFRPGAAASGSVASFAFRRRRQRPAVQRVIPDA